MAGSVNKVILIGRLGQDPKLAYLPSGSPAAEFTLATDESYKNREGQKVEQTEWHRIKVYGKPAEFCSNYLSKGRLVYVEGTLRTRKWEKDGVTHYTTEVVVSGPGHTVQFMDSRGAAGEAAQGGGSEQYQGGQQAQSQGRKPRPGAPAPSAPSDEDLGPAFPSEASGMDDVPF
ncbi:MAG: single-stranded DNA-binding protein [Desulfovibrionaceae bacterium]|nr:single-stranded DNA-binding protein [Desulfovibrionaceae bacterium]MBF0513187.1 single-stranded DNA-binding protein [Desulfovibrionaceae bacterium]